jgi:hypothetical protein
MTVVARDAAGLLAAAGSGGWILCLADGVEAEDGAFGAWQGDSGVRVLAGLVVDADGEIVERWLPRGPEDDPAGVIAAAQRRTMPLRRFTLAHTLVHADVVARHGVPDSAAFGPHAEEVWSDRVMRAEAGLFVPGAIAHVAEVQAPAARASLPQTLRAARADAWSRGEVVRHLWSGLAARR